MNTTILILGSERDDHGLYVRDAIERAGHAVAMFDTSAFPGQTTLSFDPARDTGSLAVAGQPLLAFDDISTVYWRMYDGVGASDLPNTEQAEIATNDARSLVETLFLRLRARWVNGFDAFASHQTKPAQLAIVSALGVSIPETLITNRAENVRDFASRHPNLIFKPVQGGAHARRLTRDHLSDETLQRLSHAPVTVQRYIPGTNIRVFVAGERVLACEVSTPAIDFRDDLDAAIVPHDLPTNVAADCRRIARALHLLWTGIDLRLSPDGRYWFLEANPSPMFIGFEEESGLPLTDALVALLTET